MGQKLADENTVNNPEQNDELGIDIVEATREQLEREIEQFKKNLDNIEKTREQYTKMFEIDKEINQIMVKNYKLIEPQREYHKIDRFWELQIEKVKEEIKMGNLKGEGYLKGLDVQEEALREQLESSESKLKDMQGE